MAVNVGRTTLLFQGRANTNLTLTNAGTWYPIPFGTEDRDDGEAHSPTVNPTRWVAPFPCTVALTGQALFNAGQTFTSTAPTYRWAFFFKNGIQLAAGGCQVYGGQLLTVNTFAGYITNVAAGDYIELHAMSGFAGTVVYGDSGLGSLMKIEQVH